MIRVRTARQRERQDASAFKDLITTPLTSVVTLPANQRFKLVSIAGCARGTPAADVTASTDRTIKAPLLAAGEGTIVDWLEADSVVTVKAGFELHVSTGLDTFKKIVTGV